jgi:spermidine/putrescine ABC transporter ATP-binding subunit
LSVEFRNVVKRYGTTTAVTGVSFTVETGTLVTLLGPSGCGKTTTLRMIAGLEMASEGRILIAGRDVTSLSATERDVSMVFQSYALFPHMSVLENVCYGLRRSGLAKDAANEGAREGLAQVGLAGYEARQPSELSGGQQQRVAVARALVFEPKLILMDEPLGALDKYLREQMQLEIRRLHQRLGVTMVYVTHDQAEALTMSDRIAVFHRGRIEQLDTPERIYEHPRNAFVARFIGENNRLAGRVESAAAGRCTIRVAAGDSRIEGTLVEPVAEGAAVSVSLRPERVQIRAPQHTIDAHPGCRLAGALREVIYLGDHVRARVAIGGHEDFMVKRPISEAHLLPDVGAPVEIFWTPEHCRAFAEER